jgi:hypothetical protein
MSPGDVRNIRRKWFNYAVRRFDLCKLDDVADWCSQRRGSVERIQAHLVQARRDLEYSVLRGEFGPPDRPAIFFIPLVPPVDRIGRYPLRLRGGQILSLTDCDGSYVPCLWAPRVLCARWLESREIRLPTWAAGEKSSPRIAADKTIQPTGEVARKRGGGQRAKYDWAKVTEVILCYLQENGVPAPGDGGQAHLERLAASTFHSDYCPSESSIRPKVSDIIKGYRESLQGGQ